MDFPYKSANMTTVVEAGGRSGETVERVAADLRNQILEGRFAPGQRLISRDIVELTGVSRGSLREAFRRLEADGLVELIPNRGAIVRRLSHDEVVKVFEIREALEGFAARLAATRIHIGENRERFLAVLDQGRVHAVRPVFLGFIKDNRAFHQEIVRVCGNPQLGELIDKYQLPAFMIQLRQTIGSEQIIGNSLTEHEDIATAILAGDPDAAYEAMKRHLWHSAEMILKLPAMVDRRMVGAG
ncbi:GntR family transcriptional regulator [Paraburkholderia phymatum]|uniref:GntR family transcriptional regulator n=1 Tax=Paraburkholderia phymatum TaxID=148447 RepID=UPI00316C193A